MEYVWAVVCGVIVFVVLFSSLKWLAYSVQHAEFFEVRAALHKKAVAYGKKDNSEQVVAANEMIEWLDKQEKSVKSPGRLLVLLSWIACIGMVALWYFDRLSEIVEHGGGIGLTAAFVIHILLIWRKTIKAAKVDKEACDEYSKYYSAIAEVQPVSGDYGKVLEGLSKEANHRQIS